MKLRITLVAFFFSLYARTACADGLFVEAGPGVSSSQGSTYMSVRYQKDTSRLFDTDSFYELSYASWNGPNNNNALSFARGLRWTGAANTYGSADIGVGHINRTRVISARRFNFISGLPTGSRWELLIFRWVSSTIRTENSYSTGRGRTTARTFRHSLLV